MATNLNPYSLSPRRQNTNDNNPATPASHTTSGNALIQTIPRILSPNLSNILPSNQAAVTATSTTGTPLRTPGTSAISTEVTIGMETGPGPLRLPKPLTAVDLYAQLEKEQEAVVNRLTRELSLLRAAQNASVVSSASSTSASGFPDSSEYNVSTLLSGHSHPTPSHFRRHRSSSAASSRSMTANNPNSMMSYMVTDRAAGRIGNPRQDSGTGTSQASIGGNGSSRRNSGSKLSLQSLNISGASSPIAVPTNSSSYHHYHGGEQWPSIYSSYTSRPAPLRDCSSVSQSVISSGGDKDVQTNNRIEEVTVYRTELEIVKKENDALRKKIRELEALVCQKKQAEAGTVKSSENENDSNAQNNQRSKDEKVKDNSGILSIEPTGA